jgi:polysaccharide export outer membrane protein
MHLATRISVLRFCATLFAIATLVSGVTAPSQSQDYKVGVADSLAVSVWGYKDLSVEVVVLPDGTISLPLIGQVTVAGLDIAGVQDQLTKRYAEFIKDPRVTVVVKTLGTIAVSVVGEVNKPGSVTLLRGSKALDAIAAAGGLIPSGAANKAQIIRAAGNVIPLDDLQATLRGEEQSNPRLESGDVLVVIEDAVATVTGQVIKPGIVLHLRQAPTLLEALSLAGGLAEHAGLEGEIIRKSGETIPVNLGALLLRGDISQNVRLEPGDEIVVPEGPSQVFVVGGVKKPGAYRVIGEVSALEALSMAGGVSPGNANGKVMLYHRATGASLDTRELSATAPQNAGQSAIANSGGAVETLRLQQILSGENSGSAAKLRPGDVLYVQESTTPSLLGQIVLPILQGIANLIYLFR